MNLFTLASKSLLHRKFVTLMTALSISLSVALLLGVERLRTSGKDSFGGAISQVDLIVGSRTGSVSLLLFSVFRIGSPSQNLDLSTADKFSKHEAVNWVEPFSLGDGFQSFPVVGVRSTFFQHFKIQSGKDLIFSQGTIEQPTKFAVIGSNVAETLKLKLGDPIVLAHGHSEDGDGFEKHEAHPLAVSAILDSTGTPVDRAVWVSLDSIEQMHSDIEITTDRASLSQTEKDKISNDDTHEKENPHEPEDSDNEDEAHEHEHEHKHEHNADSADELTETSQPVSGFFVGLKERATALHLMREINEYKDEPLTAIMPAVVMHELWRTLAVGENAMSLVAAMVAVVGIIGMWVSLHILASTRSREIAILRAIGANPRSIFALLTGEALLICVIGIFGGIAMLQIGLQVISPLIVRKYGLTLQLTLPTTYEYLYLLGLIFFSIVAGMLPAIIAIRGALKSGLTTKF
ncbi:MAG: ABC transporter permease [Proteobacteria bacterium]|nr:ABC transporter permease [Pseudomonadota bacterium]